MIKSYFPVILFSSCQKGTSNYGEVLVRHNKESGELFYPQMFFSNFGLKSDYMGCDVMGLMCRHSQQEPACQQGPNRSVASVSNPSPSLEIASYTPIVPRKVKALLTNHLSFIILLEMVMSQSGRIL